jgi:hypothetical protein
MRTTKLAYGAAFLLALAPWAAWAQESAGWSDGKASWKTGDQLWFETYIAPSLKTFPYYEQSMEQPNELFEAAPQPHGPPPDRTIYKYQTQYGKVRPTIVAGDLPANRDERADVKDWNDGAGNAMHPELFRFYLEPAPKAAPASTPPVSAH